MRALRELATLRASSLENPTRPLTDASLLDVLGGARTEAGVSVTAESALGIITVLRGTALIAGAVAGLPLKAYDRATAEEKPNPALDVEVGDDATPFDLWETTLAHMVLWGNAYHYKVRNQAGQVVHLQPIHPSRVDVTIDTDTARTVGLPWVKKFTVDGKSFWTSRDIMHLPCLSTDGIKGIDPITKARQALGIALAGDKAAAKFYGNGFMLGGILTTDQELADDRALALKRRWQAMVGGLDNAHETAVLDRGAKYQPLAMPPATAQFLESRRFQVTEIARWLGIPGWMLNDQEKSTSWGTGMEQQFTMFVQLTLKPYLQRIEQRVTREVLLLPKQQKAEFKVEGLLRGDSKARAAFYASGIQHGWLVPNEPRRLENLPPVPWGDEPYRPFNESAAAQTGDQPDDSKE